MAVPSTAAPTPAALADLAALPAGATGLTDSEATARAARGEANIGRDQGSRSLASIVRGNVVTRFNALLGTLFVIMLVVGPLQDALFGIVLVLNTVIGIIQEWRAKLTLDRLTLLVAPRAVVCRDHGPCDLALSEIVRGDLVALRTGDQVVVDGPVIASNGLEVDESLLTGEPDPVPKAIGDGVQSGSLVVAGRGWMEAEKVGDASYARQIAAEAKQFAPTPSELRRGIDQILRWITWVIVPVGVLLMISQLRSSETFSKSVSATVAGLVGMVPEGLVLLTSMTFALSVVALGRRKVLVQELAAVEGLARVDVVCFDKTGTLTDGGISFDRIIGLDGAPVDAEIALRAVVEQGTHNATVEALRPHLPPAPVWEMTSSVAFSSARKWSGATFRDHGSWLFGAPEMILDPIEQSVVLERVRLLADEGRRVLLFAAVSEPPLNDTNPGGVTPCALVCFTERVRPDAADTLAFFARQNVAVKIISGDNPTTVAAVLRQVGVEAGGESVIDSRTLSADPDALADRLENGVVFGRTSPQQKRSMVTALQHRGHVVAMTGDGVNDALALKASDLGVAMGSGAPATRAVAQIVILDGRFSSLPVLVAEGRRVIGNVERVAKLFVTKTVYATLIAVATGVIGLPYPFLPRHLTLVSSLTIGIPGFLLALGPSEARYRPGFARRVGVAALPAGLVAAISVFTGYAIALDGFGVPVDEARTMATLGLAIVALWVVVMLARPFTRWRAVLVGALAGGFALAVVLPFGRHFFALHIPPVEVVASVLPIAVGGVFGLEFLARLVARYWNDADPDTELVESSPLAAGVLP